VPRPGPLSRHLAGHVRHEGAPRKIVQHEPPCSLAGHGCGDGAPLCPPDAPPAALAALSRTSDGGGCGHGAAGGSIELLAAHAGTRAAHQAAPAGELLCSLSVLRVADRGACCRKVQPWQLAGTCLTGWYCHWLCLAAFRVQRCCCCCWLAAGRAACRTTDLMCLGTA
jgi:hypothetical protein